MTQFKTLKALFMASLGLCSQALQAAPCDEIVQFSPGSHSIVKTGALTGKQVRHYCLWAKAGQSFGGQIAGPSEIQAQITMPGLRMDLVEHSFYVVQKTGYQVVQVYQDTDYQTRKPKHYQISFKILY